MNTIKRSQEFRLDGVLTRYCPCCGHQDGVCSTCSRMHHPATPKGCEACEPLTPREISALVEVLTRDEPD